MVKLNYLLFISILTFFISCGSSKSTTKDLNNEVSLEECSDEKNRYAISLLNRIRRLRGVSMRSGKPVLNIGNNSFQSGFEPLYVLDNYVVGNSFASVDELVESINVKKIEILSGPDASFYGARASNGVIKITTYQ